MSATMGPMKAPMVSKARWNPNTLPLCSLVVWSDRYASRALVRMPLPRRSEVRAKNIHRG